MLNLADDHEAIDAFRKRYTLFISKHGELYENSELPMTDADVGKLKSLYFVLAGVPFTIASAYGIAGFVFEFTFDNTGLIFLGIFYVAAMLLLFKGFSVSKDNKMKTVVKAVITKRTVGTHPRLWLSERDCMRVSDADASAHALGDVVEVEIIGSFFMEAGYKIKYLGRISGEGEIGEAEANVPSTVPVDHNSIWAKAGRAWGKRMNR